MKVKLNISLDEALEAYVRTVAADEHRSFSNAIEVMIRYHMDSYGIDPDEFTKSYSYRKQGGKQ